MSQPQTPQVGAGEALLASADELQDDYHSIVQDILEMRAAMLCGFRTRSVNREKRTYIQADFICWADPTRLIDDDIEGLRPFSHWRTQNIVEIEGRTRSLTEARFRYHTGRALTLETHPKTKGKVGQTTLTILCSRYPRKLLSMEQYRWEEEHPWKIHSHWDTQLSITLIILPRLRKVAGNEALAWLQILDPSPSKRQQTWTDLLAQNFPGAPTLKDTMLMLDKETVMTFIEQLKEEFREEIKEENRKEIAADMIKDGVAENIIIKYCRLTKADFLALKELALS